MRVRGLLSASFLFLCCGGLHHGAVGKFPAVQVAGAGALGRRKPVTSTSRRTGRRPMASRITAPNSHSTHDRSRSSIGALRLRTSGTKKKARQWPEEPHSRRAPRGLRRSKQRRQPQGRDAHRRGNQHRARSVSAAQKESTCGSAGTRSRRASALPCWPRESPNESSSDPRTRTCGTTECCTQGSTRPRDATTPKAQSSSISSSRRCRPT